MGILMKRRRVFFLAGGAAFIIAMLALGAGYFLHPVAKKPTPGLTGESLRKYRLKIEGLHLYGLREGRKTIEITTDRFVIEKRKIGFFSIGLSNVLRMENAGITLFAYSKGTDDVRSSRNHRETASTIPAGRFREASFRHVLTNDALATLPVPSRNISAIEAAPVQVSLYGDDVLLTRIHAASGQIRMKEKQIIFEGNVLVTSGTSQLKTEALVLLPEEGILRAEKPYNIKRRSVVEQGARIDTDIFLDPVRASMKKIP